MASTTASAARCSNSSGTARSWRPATDEMGRLPAETAPRLPSGTPDVPELTQLRKRFRRHDYEPVGIRGARTS